MKYISKGAILRPSTENILYVSRCGREYALSTPLSSIWLEGRFRVFDTKTPEDDALLLQLRQMCLVETSDENSHAAVYRMLTQCILVPAKLKRIRRRLNATEMVMWKWISRAGLQLTIAELVFLSTNGIKPENSLLGKDNIQKLTESIYTQSNIQDNVLELEMENAFARDNTVETILNLLRKKRLIIM